MRCPVSTQQPGLRIAVFEKRFIFSSTHNTRDTFLGQHVLGAESVEQMYSLLKACTGPEVDEDITLAH